MNELAGEVYKHVTFTWKPEQEQELTVHEAHGEWNTTLKLKIENCTENGSTRYTVANETVSDGSP